MFNVLNTILHIGFLVRWQCHGDCLILRDSFLLTEPMEAAPALTSAINQVASVPETTTAATSVASQAPTVGTSMTADIKLV